MSPNLLFAVVTVFTVASILRAGNNEKLVETGWSGLDGLPGVDGYVHCIAADNSGNIFVGGYFTLAGNTLANSIAVWDGIAWNPVESGANGTISALVTDKAGTLYAAGRFDTIGGTPAQNVAQWDGREWRALGSGTDNWVYAMALDSSGGICIGGSFATAGAVNANGIARWDGKEWQSLGSGVNRTLSASKYCSALAVGPDGDMYAAGLFDSIGGVPAKSIARWDGTSWNPFGSGTPSLVDSWISINAVVVDKAGSVYIGGIFAMRVDADTVRNIARWNGNAWSGLDEGIGGMYSSVHALAFDKNETLYAGGYFSTIAGDTVAGFRTQHIARWNGTSWTALRSGIASENGVATLFVDKEGILYAGGDFKIADTVAASGIATWSDDTWGALGKGTNDVIYSILDDRKGNLYAAGEFTSITGVYAHRIARREGSQWKPLGRGVRSSEGACSIHEMALDSTGNLYVMGVFDSAGSVAAKNIARWDGIAWYPLGEGIDRGEIDYSLFNALAADRTGKIYAGGAFSKAGGITVSNIACWDGSVWSNLGGGTDAEVMALAIDKNGNCFAGGRFDSAGGIPASMIAQWNGSVWSVPGGRISSRFGSIQSLTFDDKGMLYAGGEFDSICGVPAGNIAQWNGTTWQALGSGITHIINFDMDIWGVFAIATDHRGNLYVGGDFDSAGGVGANQVARWNGTSWSALGSGLGTTYYAVMGMDVDAEANLYICGNLLTAGGKVAPYMARYTPEITAHDKPITHDRLTGKTKFSISGNRITVDLPAAAQLNYRIIDLVGREVASRTMQLQEGCHAVTVPVQKCSRGMYLIDASAGGERVRKKMVLY